MWAKPFRRHDPEFTYTFTLKGNEREKAREQMLATNSKAGAYATKMYLNVNMVEVNEGNMTNLRKRNNPMM